MTKEQGTLIVEQIGYIYHILSDEDIDISDLLMYGSFFDEQNNDPADVDAIMCVPLCNIPERSQFTAPLMRKFYYSWSNSAIFRDAFRDVFILDNFHIRDGRFVIFDRDFIENLQRYGHVEICSREGIFERVFSNVVFLRNQNEFELANGLHFLRNYLFFEIPKKVEDVSPERIATALKYFKVLPRVTSFLFGEGMATSPEYLQEKFGHINYDPLQRLWSDLKDPFLRNLLIRSWHHEYSSTFHEYEKCFEKTLIAIRDSMERLST